MYLSTKSLRGTMDLGIIEVAFQINTATCWCCCIFYSFIMNCFFFVSKNTTLLYVSFIFNEYCASIFSIAVILQYNKNKLMNPKYVITRATLFMLPTLEPILNFYYIYDLTAAYCDNILQWILFSQLGLKY